MTLPGTLTVLAAAANGLLAGLSLEVALVKLPSRRRIGPVAYAAFARGADLGNGRVVYPAVAVGAALLTFAATLAAYLGRSATSATLPLSVASLASVLHFAATARAAPIMLGIGRAPDDPGVLQPRLDAFARWHAVRAALQVLTFFVLLWALAST
jgi:hypothetical protein